MNSIHLTKFTLLLLCFVFIRQQTTPAGLSCNIIFNGNCYIYVSTSMTWFDAEDNCVSMGGHLTSIHSDAENTAVNSIMQGEYTHIGCNDIMSEGTFLWSDGSNFSYTNWLPNNIGSEDCCQLQFDSDLWNAFSCTDSDSSICKVTCPPSPNITNLTYAYLSPESCFGTITLNWTTIVIANSYTVLLNGTSIGNINVNYYISGLLNLLRHYAIYTVIANNDSLSSSASSPVIFTPPAAPSQPTIATISYAYDSVTSCTGTITLTWLAVSSDRPVNSYEVLQIGTNIATLSPTAGNNTYTTSSMLLATFNARYTVRAGSCAGVSVSNEVVFTPPTPPAANLSISTTYDSAASCTGNITLTWLAVATNITVTSYEVLLDGISQSLLFATAGINTYTTSSISLAILNGKYTVRAGSCAGLSVSNEVVFTPPTSPSQPTITTISSAYDSDTSCTGTITLAWLAVASDRLVTSYTVYLNGTVDGTSGNATYTTGSLNLLEHYANYTVRATSCAGSSMASSPVMFTPLTSAPPSAANISISTTYDSATSCNGNITLTWLAVTSDRNVTSYEVLLNGTNIATLSPTAGTNNYTTSSMSLDTFNGRYTVRAVSCVGSSISNEVVFTPRASPSQPTITTISSAYDSDTSCNGTITLTWPAVTSDRPVNSYAVYLNGTVDGTTGNTSYTTGSLNLLEHYATYTVMASNCAGSSMASSPAMFTPLTSAPPYAPTSVNISSAYDSTTSCNGTITLTWLAVTSDRAVTSYEVLQNSTVDGTTGNTTYKTGSLNLLEHYATYTIMATSCAGNSTSIAVVFTPLNPASPTAANLSISTTYDSATSCTGNITLTWLAVTFDRTVTSYTVLLNGTDITTLSPTAGTNTYTTSNMSLDIFNGTFTVRAVSCAGSSISNEVIFTTPNTPSAANISISIAYDTADNSTGTITLTWPSVTSDRAVTSYEVLLNGTNIATLSPTAGTNTYTTSSMALATFNARYTVRAVSCAGSSVSNEVVFTPIDPTLLNTTRITIDLELVVIIFSVHQVDLEAELASLNLTLQDLKIALAIVFESDINDIQFTQKVAKNGYFQFNLESNKFQIDPIYASQLILSSSNSNIAAIASLISNIDFTAATITTTTAGTTQQNSTPVPNALGSCGSKDCWTVAGLTIVGILAFLIIVIVILVIIYLVFLNVKQFRTKVNTSRDTALDKEVATSGVNIELEKRPSYKEDKPSVKKSPVKSKPDALIYANKDFSDIPKPITESPKKSAIPENIYSMVTPEGSADPQLY